MINKINLSFNGTTKYIRKKELSPSNIEIIRRYQPNEYASNIVGNIPFELISHIPIQEREQYIKNFYTQLNKKVKTLRQNGRYYDKEIKEFLSKYGIKKFDYLAMGGYGIVFSFYTSGPNPKKYVLKIFNDTNKRKLDGNITEQANAIALTRQKAKVANIYWGDFDAGYMVSEFIEKDSFYPDKKLTLSDLNYENLDNHENNYINGILIDYGGIRKIKKNRN